MTYAGFKDENGVLPRDAIRKQFNGSLFYEYAAKMGKSMKEKKVGEVMIEFWVVWFVGSRVWAVIEEGT